MVTIDTGQEGATTISFPLRDFVDDVSPLGWLPYAFEDMAVRMDDGEKDIVRWLNGYTPQAMRTGSVRATTAGTLFLDIVERRDMEVKRLEDLSHDLSLSRGGRRVTELYLDFWQHLLPAALTRPYGGEGEMDAIVYNSLADLCSALDIEVPTTASS